MALTRNRGPCCCAEGVLVTCCGDTALPEIVYAHVTGVGALACITGTYPLTWDGSGSWLGGGAVVGCSFPTLDIGWRCGVVGVGTAGQTLTMFIPSTGNSSTRPPSGTPTCAPVSFSYTNLFGGGASALVNEVP